MKTVPGANEKRISGTDFTRTWCDAIAIEGLFVWQFLPLSLRLLAHFFRLLRCPEPSTTLLIHFRPRGDAVNSHEEKFLGFYFAEQQVDVSKY
jgi:hypothetical protein